MAVAKVLSDVDHAIVVAQVVSLVKDAPASLTIYTSTIGTVRWKFASDAARDALFTSLIAAMNA